MPTLKLKPNSNHFYSFHSREFRSSADVASFIGMHIATTLFALRKWDLYVNNRLYSWPTIEVNTGELTRHIDHCIEMDEAFYETS